MNLENITPFGEFRRINEEVDARSTYSDVDLSNTTRFHQSLLGRGINMLVGLVKKGIARVKIEAYSKRLESEYLAALLRTCLAHNIDPTTGKKMGEAVAQESAPETAEVQSDTPSVAAQTPTQTTEPEKEETETKTGYELLREKIKKMTVHSQAESDQLEKIGSGLKTELLGNINDQGYYRIRAEYQALLKKFEGDDEKTNRLKVDITVLESEIEVIEDIVELIKGKMDEYNRTSGKERTDPKLAEFAKAVEAELAKVGDDNVDDKIDELLQKFSGQPDRLEILKKIKEERKKRGAVPESFGYPNMEPLLEKYAGGRTAEKIHRVLGSDSSKEFETYKKLRLDQINDEALEKYWAAQAKEGRDLKAETTKNVNKDGVRRIQAAVDWLTMNRHSTFVTANRGLHGEKEGTEDTQLMRTWDQKVETARGLFARFMNDGEVDPRELGKKAGRMDSMDDVNKVSSPINDAANNAALLAAPHLKLSPSGVKSGEYGLVVFYIKNRKGKKKGGLVFQRMNLSVGGKAITAFRYVRAVNVDHLFKVKTKDELSDAWDEDAFTSLKDIRSSFYVFTSSETDRNTMMYLLKKGTDNFSAPAVGNGARPNIICVSVANQRHGAWPSTGGLEGSTGNDPVYKMTKMTDNGPNGNTNVINPGAAWPGTKPIIDDLAYRVEMDVSAVFRITDPPTWDIRPTEPAPGINKDVVKYLIEKVFKL